MQAAGFFICGIRHWRGSGKGIFPAGRVFRRGGVYAGADYGSAGAGGEETFRRVPSMDISGHGTAVAAIAAGSNPNARYTGAAPGAALLIVKLGQAGSGAYRARPVDAGNDLCAGQGVRLWVCLWP